MKRDKALHASAGLLIGLLSIILSPLATVCVSVIVAGAKELYDSKSGGTVEFLDGIYTVTGTVAMIIVLELLLT